MFSRILVLAPHTDDGELGCGGTIAKLLEEDVTLWYVALSVMNEELRAELSESMEALGVQKKNVLTYGYPIRHFSSKRQNILEDLIELRDEINPDMVFMPSPADLHQDHSTVAQEAERAFKKTTLLGYEQPWNNFAFNAACFMPLELRHMGAKMSALDCYKSQQHRPYFHPTFISGLARTRGTQIERPFAEAFEVIRWVMQ